jgi:hypothetical protein
MAWSTGPIAWKVSSGPPTRIEISPEWARWQPPVIGASSTWAPRSAARAPRRLASSTSVVLISIQVLPGPRPASTPAGPSITARTAAGDGREVITTSQSRASAAGLSPHRAPAARSSSARSRARSRTLKP